MLKSLTIALSTEIMTRSTVPIGKIENRHNSRSLKINQPTKIMEIIQQRSIQYETRYSLEFEYDDEAGNGYAFDCNQDGQPFFTRINESGETVYNPLAEQTYEQCLTGMIFGRSIKALGLREIKYSYKTPSIGLCNVCNTQVELEHFTNTCDNCGTDYNSSGSQLASRHLWGEETGEHPSECI